MILLNKNMIINITISSNSASWHTNGALINVQKSVIPKYE